MDSEGVGLAFETHAPAGKAAAGQFTALKYKKAPRGANRRDVALDTPPRWRPNMARKQLEDEVVLDPRANTDELALIAAL